MKTSHRGFIVPLLLVIVALMLVGGGAYMYLQKNQATPTVVENTTLPQATSTVPAAVPEITPTAQVADCADFDALSQFVMTSIEKPNTQKAPTDTGNFFRWKRSPSEVIIGYPIIRGIEAYYIDTLPTDKQPLLLKLKSNADLLSKTLSTETIALGLTPDTLNTILLQSLDFDVTQTFGYRKGNSLYSIVVVGGQHPGAIGEGVIQVLCGKKIDQYDKFYDALNFKADLTIQDSYGHDFINIGNISPDNTVYEVGGWIGKSGLVHYYYYFDGATTTLVSQYRSVALCTDLESKKVGKGMKCWDSTTPNGFVRKVTY